MKAKIISKTLDKNSEFTLGQIVEVTKTFSTRPNTVSMSTVESLPNLFEIIKE